MQTPSSLCAERSSYMWCSSGSDSWAWWRESGRTPRTCWGRRSGRDFKRALMGSPQRLPVMLVSNFQLSSDTFSPRRSVAFRRWTSARGSNLPQNRNCTHEGERKKKQAEKICWNVEKIGFANDPRRIKSHHVFPGCLDPAKDVLGQIHWMWNVTFYSCEKDSAGRFVIEMGGWEHNCWSPFTF